jgi:predicted nucleic acid-binding Zn ribbon protein
MLEGPAWEFKLMNLIPCRDCGNMIDPSSRGCSTCAMNLDAERIIDRFVLYGLLLGGILIAGIIVMLYLLL